MEKVRPSTLPFTASFDLSNPLGFLEKVLHFLGKESNFLRKDTAQKEIIDAVTVAKENNKKIDPMEIEKVRSSTLPYSASFDLSDLLGFLDKVFNFIGKESNFLTKDTAEKEIIDTVTAAKERLKEEDKTEKKSVKQGKKYGLKIRAPSHKKQSSSSRPTSSIFGEDEDNDVEKEISRQASKTKDLKKIEEQHKKALEEDPSAFAYDEVYDDTKQKTVVSRMQDREEHKPRYVQHLMKQAERRKKEQEIVYERKLAKERAKDEHLFADKEKLVTGSYKRKLEEQNKWIAEERLRELREEKDDVTKKKDLSDFYFNIGKNVAFGARDIEAREAEKEQRKVEKLEEVIRKEETRKEKKRKSPESSVKKSVESTQEASEKKKMSVEAKEERLDASMKEAAKEFSKATRKDTIAAAKERFLARKKAKIQE